MNRIILVYPGGELILHRYKKPMPAAVALKKASEFAFKLFETFNYSTDPDMPAIESPHHNAMILLLSGPSTTVPSL